jgi:1-acyl-sn-glycerol-3-phosphate acyltransferase/nitroimidazol reductase NimA-like FMN-containing flavoprotein (pyridoxamine 5'-phosphate oxidase superfamily)
MSALAADSRGDAVLFDVLAPDECRRLLASTAVGRVSVATSDAPAIRPVNYALDGDRIVIRTGESLLWQASRKLAPAGFEIDATDSGDHTGWSVVVTGRVSELEPDEHVLALPLRPWVPGSRERFVAVSIDTLSGRRLAPSRRAPGAERNESDPDHWGRSTSQRRSTARVVEPLYRWWFRVSWTGTSSLPRRGGALLVANHAGAVPVDGLLAMHGIEKEIGRPVYALHHHRLRELPYAGELLARHGGVLAHPDNALRLLRDEQQLVLVFPEGTKGTTKLYRDRYRLARFGRGGFVETAMRAGVPVIPIAVTGTEETMPSFARLPLTEETGIPVPLNFVLLGAAGGFLHFPARITYHVLEPIVLDHPAGLDHYPASDVAAATELVRRRLQSKLDDYR